MWHPVEPSLPQTAGKVSHHPPGPTGEGGGRRCPTQGSDACPIVRESQKMTPERLFCCCLSANLLHRTQLQLFLVVHMCPVTLLKQLISVCIYTELPFCLLIMINDTVLMPLFGQLRLYLLSILTIKNQIFLNISNYTVTCVCLLADSWGSCREFVHHRRQPAVLGGAPSAVQLCGRLDVRWGLLFRLHYHQHHWFWGLRGGWVEHTAGSQKPTLFFWALI